MIPLPNVSHNHQQYNAEVLANLDAAKIIQNSELNEITLHDNIEEILNYGKLEEMGSNARKAAILDVEDKIYEEIKRLLKR
ncbi:MAG: hypothetical protein HFJ51_03665 [Clostridia bacterium]|nr:hypothetical protein [Clostridia bacterium]